MDIQYFKSAWGDIKNSRGWFGKICLLALLNIIPIFGQIVALAYAYGWAREMAWSLHKPMPTKIFSNEDGKFWRRGWFVFVLTFVFLLIPGVIYAIGATMETSKTVLTLFGPQVVVDPVMSGVGSLLRIVGFICMVIVGIFAWVGSMRISIYDRLSAGFQLGKIWKMMRHDMSGLMRVFGMELLVSLVMGVFLVVVFTILTFFVVTAGLAGLMNAGYALNSLQYLTQAQQAQLMLQFAVSAGPTGMISLMIGGFLASVCGVFIQLLVARAVGYWTMQFEVPLWGDQDDPMPFELVHEPEPEYEESGHFAPPASTASAPAASASAPAAAAPTAPAAVAPAAEPSDTVVESVNPANSAAVPAGSAVSDNPSAPSVAPATMKAPAETASSFPANEFESSGTSAPMQAENFAQAKQASEIASTRAPEPVPPLEVPEEKQAASADSAQINQGSESAQLANGEGAGQAAPKVTYVGPANQGSDASQMSAE